ncbi:MAG: LamG domain-containing protein, partial [Planctomycetia bacterium]|nr:LamG domain-containing protein [Planctomycetia bacterium]
YGSKLKLDQRVHVAAVVSKDSIVLFVDGKQVAKQGVKFDKLPPTTPPTLIGKQTSVAPKVTSTERFTAFASRERLATTRSSSRLRR